MSEPYWWAWMLFWWMSGAATAYMVAVIRRPARVECPNCGIHQRTRRFRDHWKRCIS